MATHVRTLPNTRARWITTHFAAYCAGCYKTIPVGSAAYYRPLTRDLFCSEHGTIEARVDAHRQEVTS